jgi:hypothetical protein
VRRPDRPATATVAVQAPRSFGSRPHCADTTLAPAARAHRRIDRRRALERPRLSSPKANEPFSAAQGWVTTFPERTHAAGADPLRPPIFLPGDMGSQLRVPLAVSSSPRCSGAGATVSVLVKNSLLGTTISAPSAPRM